MFAIGSKLTYLCVFWDCATPPHIHPGGSLHVISFTRHSPTSVMQVTNTAVKRTGYEANVPECMVLRQVFEQPSLHLSQVNSRKCDDSKVLRHELPSLHKSTGKCSTLCHVICYDHYFMKPSGNSIIYCPSEEVGRLAGSSVHGTIHEQP